MELSRSLLILTVLAGASGFTSAWADNPYQTIVTRNAFGLNPPEIAAPPVEVPPPPPEPVATVKLTGITSIFGPPKAIFEITEPGGKEVIKPPPLAAGTSMNGVHVVSIDVEKFEVVVKTGGITTNVVFDAPVLASTPPPPPKGPAGVRPTAPGRPPATGTPRMPTASSRTYAPPTAPTPTTIDGGGNISGSGRISVGGGQLTTTIEPSTTSPSVPTRNIRTPGMSRQEALELMKMQRSIPTPPLPPIQR